MREFSIPDLVLLNVFMSCVTLSVVGSKHTAVLDDNMSQVCDLIFIDVHKLLRMYIVLKALHSINACFSGKHASRTCRFNHSSCISKNRPF